MAEKSAIVSGVANTAVARVVEQGATQWGVSEHLAFLRYMVNDAMAQAPKQIEAAVKAAGTDAAKLAAAKALTVGTVVNETLKATFSTDPEIAYASNFQKLLVKAGILKSGGGYE